MQRKELIYYDARIIKAVISKPSRALTPDALKCKKLVKDTISILKNRYNVEPVVVEWSELEDGIEAE